MIPYWNSNNKSVQEKERGKSAVKIAVFDRLFIHPHRKQVTGYSGG